LVAQAGLLGERRREDQGRLVAPELDETPDERVHLLVAVQDRALVLRLLLRGRRDLEMPRLEVAPIKVLHVRRAVEEERRERGPLAAVDRLEHVVLEPVEDERALPAIVPTALGRELPD